MFRGMSFKIGYHRHRIIDLFCFRIFGANATLMLQFAPLVHSKNMIKREIILYLNPYYYHNVSENVTSDDTASLSQT